MAHQEPVTATVTRGGKLHLPTKVMQTLNVKEGQQIVFFLKEGKALLVPFSSALLKQSF